MKKLIIALACVFVCAHVMGQTYSLPNTNSGCPSNCRIIPWQAGSDVWNSGVLPSYTSVTCSGLHANGTTDDSSGIQSCITAASANTAVFLPAGTYLVNSTLRLKSNVVLRGAKAEGGPPFLPATDAAATTIKVGTSAAITTQNFSYTGGNLYPTVSYATFPSTFCNLSGTPQKGDTTVTINSGGSCAVSVGQWIIIAGNDDPSLISAFGDDGHCDWCGINDGYNVMTQIVQVTAMSGSGGVGTVATLSKPLYYTPDPTSRTVNSHTEPAGVHYSLLNFGTQKAGFENIRFDASAADIQATQILFFQGCLECWVKNVETYGAGSGSGSAHVEMDFTYGMEVRDSAFHDQSGATGSSNVNNNTAGDSGAGYGVYFQFVNSDAKVENNILFHNRHWIVYQGGGSGTAILYNYADNGYTDDLSYLGSGRTSHGAHPFMNLFEGNVTSHITADDFWGTSSHDVFFRNWMWGGETNTVASGCTGSPTPPKPQCSIPLFPPNGGYNALDLYTGQLYYSFVGNVLGSTSSMVTLGLQPTWANASLTGYDQTGYSASAPVVYSVGGASNTSFTGGTTSSSSATILRHGNYDFKTNGVAFWDGGSTHALASGIYYGSAPSFFGSCTWPSIGPDITPVATTSMPAYNRYSGNTCSGAPPPTIPTGLNPAGRAYANYVFPPKPRADEGPALRSIAYPSRH